MSTHISYKAGQNNKKCGRMRLLNNYGRFLIRTDLAIEDQEVLTDEDKKVGIEVTEDVDSEFNIKTTLVNITDEAGAKIIGKPCGKYITIESTLMQLDDKEAHEKISEILAIKLAELLPYEKNVLVVGLGNSGITPDSLGPRVVSNLLITRHLHGETNNNSTAMAGFGNISAISPGVMGQTGMETQEIIKGIVAETKPDYIIAIDALASRKVSRVNTTIQLSDTGIHPGAGIGNKRKGLTFESLGIPVISIGVPTVVDAPTIINDALDGIIDVFENNKLGDISNELRNLDPDEKYRIIKKAIDPGLRTMFVAPKDVDSVVKNLGNIIADGINLVLHHDLSREQIRQLTY
ncbi:MAG: hypothetical protein K0R15_1918 [Clostridiales bacterium]|jgi:spore protease|nr:hypothetical protein [Clostridiales bacterium]